jgi:serine protease AprX
MTNVLAVRYGSSAPRRLAGTLLAFILAASGLAATPAFASNGQGTTLDRQVALGMQRGTPFNVMLIARGDLNDVIRDLHNQGINRVKRVPIVHGVSATLTPAGIRYFAADPNVFRIVYDAPVRLMDTALSAAALATAYPAVDNAVAEWGNPLAPLTGMGVGVAVIDSGIAQHSDFASRVTVNLNFCSTATSPADQFGHGTVVAGIIGGNGTASNGQYIGIAPQVTLLNLRVNDATGAAATSDIMNAILWVVNNQSTFNIRVLNLSLISSVAESYTTSPLDAAVEYAWLKGIAVVVAAGNLGPNSALYAPANDPYVITVGATDDAGTVTAADDTLAAFSSYGVTQDGFIKPDLVAPGRHLVSTVAAGSTIATTYPQNLVGTQYVMLSGTSVAAPQVSGIAALYLEAHQGIRPGQLKGVLKTTAHGFGLLGTVPVGAGAGYADAVAAINYNGTIGNLDGGLDPNNYLKVMYLAANNLPAGTVVSWGSVSWGSVSWGSVSWGNIVWTAVSWGY